MGGLAKDPLELLSLFQYFLSFISQRKRMIAEEIDQRADRDESVFGGKPLWRRKSLRPFRIPGTLFKKKGHGILICRKEIQNRAYAETMR